MPVCVICGKKFPIQRLSQAVVCSEDLIKIQSEVEKAIIAVVNRHIPKPVVSKVAHASKAD
jgi:hypothetical protein